MVRLPLLSPSAAEPGLAPHPRTPSNMPGLLPVTCSESSSFPLMGSFREVNISQIIACTPNHTQIDAFSHWPTHDPSYMARHRLQWPATSGQYPTQFLNVPQSREVLSFCSLKYVKRKIAKISPGRDCLEAMLSSRARFACARKQMDPAGVVHPCRPSVTVSFAS